MIATNIQAVVFDYGNTLVEFGPVQTAACDTALADAVERLCGPLDRRRLKDIRDRNRMAIYADGHGYRENDLTEITTEMIRELYGVDPSPETLARILQVRFDVFVASTRATEEVRALLRRLSARYPLGLLSNYPDGEAIRVSLAKVGLDGYFRSVVVSGDIGFVKPHPLPFETIARELDVSPQEILFVGDNWLADIQGAKRAGMRAAHTVEYVSYEQFERKAQDYLPDITLKRLAELESHV